MYDRYLEQVSSFGVVMNNLPTQLSYFHNIRADMEQNYCFQMLPCLTFGIPDYFFDKYIYPEIPSRDKLIAMLMDYVHSIRKRFTEHPVRFIFLRTACNVFWRQDGSRNILLPFTALLSYLTVSY